MSMPTITEEEGEGQEAEGREEAAVINNELLVAVPPPPPPPSHIFKPATMTTMTASDILTMDTMMNMEAYTKYLKRKQLTSGIKDQIDATERKFYRRRILDLTKEMFRGGHRAESGINSTGVETAFETYIRACIMHFKFTDLADVLQTEYADMVVSAPTNTTTTPPVDDISDFNKLCFNPEYEYENSNTPNTKKLVKIKAPTSNALELLFIPAGAASSDIDKDKEAIHNNNNNNNNNKASFAPKTRDVNLMDEQFKTKGIKSRHLKSKPEP